MNHVVFRDMCHFHIVLFGVYPVLCSYLVA